MALTWWVEGPVKKHKTPSNDPRTLCLGFKRCHQVFGSVSVSLFL